MIVTVGRLLLVNTTSSVDVQVPLVVVQRSVALVPTGMPVTVEVAEDGVVIVAVPLTTLHTPVPTLALLPASVKAPLLQLTRSVPAAATVAAAWFVSSTSSVEVHVPLVVVHRKVTLLPAVTPVTVVVADAAVVIVAEPLTILQAPVPVVAAVAAMVNVLLLHCVWSGPAAAVVGWLCTVAVPVDTVCVVALVELALTLPDTPLVASDFKRT